jgi:error-prone DNA polymerase
MLANGYSGDFADRVFRQIQGFGEYGFPESHAASFALLVYVSAWLKCYYPAAFAAAMLNSQPMGFYAPAQLVADAKKHGVEIRPVDVNFSEWDCTLEAVVGGQWPVVSRPTTDHWPLTTDHCLRLGLRLVRGLSQKHAEAVMQARRPFTSFDDCVRQTGLSSAVLKKLAAADAFGSVPLGRRAALWQSLDGSVRQAYSRRRTGSAAGSGASARVRLTHPTLFDHVDRDQPPAALPPMAPLQEVVADYESIGLTLRQHPMSFLRPQLDEAKVAPAKDLATLPVGRTVRVAGVVLLRQRPGTAKGITFVTLEDETGMANLIVRQEIWERYRRAARTATVMLVQGILQREAGVIHVLAAQLEDWSGKLASLVARSRDFR